MSGCGQYIFSWGRWPAVPAGSTLVLSTDHLLQKDAPRMASSRQEASAHERFRVCSVRGPSAPAVLLLLLPSPPPLAFSCCQSNLQQPRRSHSCPKIPSGAHSPPARVAPASPRICLCLGCSSSTRKRQERETWTMEKAVWDSYLHLLCALKI